MAAVTITWNQRAAGRWPGDVETVELTPFVEGALKGGKASVVLVEHAPSPEPVPVEVHEDPASILATQPSPEPVPVAEPEVSRSAGPN